MSEQRPTARSIDLPGVHDTDILGVPVSALEELAALRRTARDGELSLTAWCTRHAEVAEACGLTDVAPEEIERVREAALPAWESVYDSLFDDAGLGKDERAQLEEVERHLLAVLRRVGSMSGPPTDAEVAREYFDDLPELRQKRADMTSVAGRESLRRTIERDERRLRSWLREIGGVDLDVETGLPSSVIESHRDIVDDVLGTFPVSVGEARARAWLDADREAREQAAVFGSWPATLDITMLRLKLEIQGHLRQSLAGLVRFAHEDDSDAGRQLVELWKSGDLAELLRRYLDETS